MNYTSSTQEVPGHGAVPRHVAIIMDGNGRWARSRLLPRIAGHRRGLEAVRATVENCAQRGIEFLTLFAFSSENWRRPAEEVSLLMQLFIRALEQEVTKLDSNGIRFRVVGDLAAKLSMAYAPEPDLFIRTGGEQRVSNFLLWQLAYTELYFTEALWPDFGADALESAFASFRLRERRFGRTSEQLREGEPVPQTG